jgi:Holliday junction DNA helicase RuvA
MIAGITGALRSKTGDRVVIATDGGVWYEIAVPVGVLEKLPALGASVSLRTVLVVRDDGWALYGFDEDHEREVFQRLLGATGVGPRLALALVSALGGSRVVRAVRDSDLGVLSTVPGVGKKTAERIVLELKDRLRDIAVPGNGMTGISAPGEQAIQALVNLGYLAAEAERAVRTAVAEGSSGEAVDLIRGALQLLTKAK